MAINYSTEDGVLVSKPAEGGSFANETPGELPTALNAANLAKIAQTAAELAETNAEASEVAAAASQAAASTSETNAAGSEASVASNAAIATTKAAEASASETNAASSAATATTQAGISTAQASTATTQAGIATTKATEASTSETNAAASETAAASSESAAASSESASAASETAAALSETNSGINETNAQTSATASASSAANSLSSANAASGSESNASNSATAAATSASTATAQASSATSSASAASLSATAAQVAETAAELAETNAEASELSASTDASTATTQAGISTTQAGISTAQAGNSATSATASATSATASAGSASTATTQAGIATTKATEASGSAATATTQAGIATTQASNSATSATASQVAETAAELAETNATTQASNAASSASAAAISATAAQVAETAAELAEVNAETAETAAELAETHAETAETNAEAAEAAALVSQTAATASQASATASAASASASASGASSSATDAQSSEDDAETSATAAAGSASASASSASASAASASNASTSATASANSATAAAASQASASTSASTATTKASEASTSATNAAASEAGVATSATNAANSASASAASAATATTKASEASTSATGAAASLASFTGQYVSSATAPASPDLGDLWFNESVDMMKVYTSLGWANAGSAINGVENSVEYTATAGQTTFTATYDVGYLQVYLNGILLAATDYTATNGTSVVLDVGASLNDMVFIQAFGTFELADHYNKVDSDARYAQESYVDTEVATRLPLAGGTLTGDVSHGDNVKAKFGASDDLQIYHDGSNSYIADTATGSLHIKGTSLFLEDADGNEFIRMSDQGSGGIVYLKNMGATKLATTATGVDVTGTLTANTSGDSNGSKGLVINTTGTNFESDAGIIQVTHAGAGSTTGGYFMKMKAGGVDKFTIKGNGDVVAAGTVTTDGLTVDGNASVAGTTGVVVDTGTITTGKDSASSRTHWRMNNTNGEVAKWDSNGTDLLHFITDEYKVYTAGNKAFEIDGNGDISFFEDQGITPKFFWDASAESLGLGTSSPSEQVSLYSNASNAIQVQSHNSSAGSYNEAALKFALSSSGSSTLNWDITAAQTALTFDYEGSPKVTIDNSGNVGIGVDPQLNKFRVTKSGVTQFIMGYGGSSINYLDGDTNIFRSGGGAERMRIDSSGNVIVGGTTAYDANATTILGNGLLYSRRTDSAALILRRDNSDGTMLSFDKSGNTVGSIGTEGGSLAIGGGDTGIGFYQGSDAIVPHSTGTNSARDAAINLGMSSARYKDLHLSGSANVGSLVSSQNATALAAGYVSELWTAYASESLRLEHNGHKVITTEGYNLPTTLKFHTYIGGASSEKMRIDSLGNVGIGTSSPVYPLVVSNSGAQGLEFIVGGTNFIQSYNRSTADYTPLKIHAETIAFGTDNGTERMRIDSSGKVGIGTSSPSSNGGATAAVCHIHTANADAWSIVHYTNGTTGVGAADGLIVGNIGADSYVFNYENSNLILGTGGAECMRIDSTGNVGIGTSSPNAALQIAKGLTTAGGPAAGAATGSACFGNDTSGSAYGLVVGADGFGTGYISAQRTDGNATTYPLIIQPNGGNVGIGTSSTNGVKTVIKGAAGYPATSGTTQNAVLRVSGGSGLYNVLDMGVNEVTDTAWIQATRANNLATSDDLAIQPNGGNVGIGTSSPTSLFHVKGDADTIARIEPNNNSGKATLLLSSTGSGDGGIQYDANNNQAHLFSYNDMTFHVGSGNLSGGYPANERMRIDSSGRLLIGTTTASGGITVNKSISYNNASTTTWINIAYVGGGQVFNATVSTGENGYSQLWTISGNPSIGVCYFAMLGGDSGHAHSKDTTFRYNGNYIQQKNVTYTTGRVIHVLGVYHV